MLTGLPRLRSTRLRLVTVALTAVVGLSLMTSTPALAGPNEGDFFGAANSARANAGLPAYTYAGDLASVARGQAERMAASGVLAHNPNLGSSVSNWQGLAENVGTGTDWPTIQQAFMTRPEHRGAILDSNYTQMGVGTAVDKDGILWVSEVFRLPMNAPSAPSSGGSSASPSSSSTSTSTATSSTGSSTSTVTAPSPSPTQILRAKIRHAREEVSGQHKAQRHSPRDPLMAALDYSTVMHTIGG